MAGFKLETAGCKLEMTCFKLEMSFPGIETVHHRIALQDEPDSGTGDEPEALMVVRRQAESPSSGKAVCSSSRSVSRLSVSFPMRVGDFAAAFQSIHRIPPRLCEGL